MRHREEEEEKAMVAKATSRKKEREIAHWTHRDVLPIMWCSES